MKKSLLVVILAIAVVLCSASTVTAQPTLTVTPNEHITCPQISEFFGTPCVVCHADKTVTFMVTVTSGTTPPVTVVVTSAAPASWFSWLTQTINLPNTAMTWPLDIKVPLTLGKDAGGTYLIMITATDRLGRSASRTVTLVVQDHDYVSETLVAGTGDVTINENVRNMAAAVSVDKIIDFHGSVDCLTKNEYLIEDAKGNNSNFEQEATVSNYRAIRSTDYLYGDERFKSCAVMGGTGADIHEEYAVNRMESRCENINHHVTGSQMYKTELCTYNTFNGELLIDARQSVPCSKHIVDSQYFLGNLTVGKHIIFRRP